MPPDPDDEGDRSALHWLVVAQIGCDVVLLVGLAALFWRINAIGVQLAKLMEALGR
jgi:hypothetical protein